LSTSSEGSIEVQRVWKRFHRDRARPFLADQVRSVGRRMRNRSDDRWRWVLRDIDFSVTPGEAVGVVGANGAGKSTLLKVLNRVMYPDAGNLEVRGRVGAIIELRGGLHPDLSGRENTHMYGALLGIPRPEITAQFDTIVDFADLGQAIDRPLKYYSSGMQMRLGFAIAAFLRPSILLVDEVLAVGDAWFQQRCLDRMREVLVDGTTLVLVSHDLASMEATCSRGLWLRSGLLVADGPIRSVLGSYRKSVEDVATGAYQPPETGLSATVAEVVAADGGIPCSHQDVDVVLTLKSERTPWHGRIYLGVSEGDATPTFVVSAAMTLDHAESTVRCRLHNIPLPRGRFSLWMHVTDEFEVDVMLWHPVGSFVLAGSELDETPTAVVRLSPVHVRAGWTRE
jgi:ABC-type polysaccharide/polyol phosphate transport system ATPase subunit